MNDLIDRNSLLNSLKKFAPEKHDALVDMLIKKEPEVDAIPIDFINNRIIHLQMRIAGYCYPPDPDYEEGTDPLFNEIFVLQRLVRMWEVHNNDQTD